MPGPRRARDADFVYEDRVDAGRRLGAELLQARLGVGDGVVVLGLPRGGVPVAAEVAKALGVPLDVLVVRKLGVPFDLEVAMGAIGEDGITIVDGDLIRRLAISAHDVDAAIDRERRVLDDRVTRLRRDRARIDLTGLTALIVDDGIATGATASAACLVARRLGAVRVVVAAPVASPDAVQRVSGADEIFCPLQPPSFRAVGSYYVDFEPTTDDEVAAILTDRQTKAAPR